MIFDPGYLLMIRIISSYFFVISSIIVSSFSVVSAMYFCLFIVVRLQVPIQVYSQMSPWFMICLAMFLSSQLSIRSCSTREDVVLLGVLHVCLFALCCPLISPVVICDLLLG